MSAYQTLVTWAIYLSCRLSSNWYESCSYFPLLLSLLPLVHICKLTSVCCVGSWSHSFSPQWWCGYAGERSCIPSSWCGSFHPGLKLTSVLQVSLLKRTLFGSCHVLPELQSGRRSAVCFLNQGRSCTVFLTTSGRSVCRSFKEAFTQIIIKKCKNKIALFQIWQQIKHNASCVCHKFTAEIPFAWCLSQTKTVFYLAAGKELYQVIPADGGNIP